MQNFIIAGLLCAFRALILIILNLNLVRPVLIRGSPDLKITKGFEIKSDAEPHINTAKNQPRAPGPHPQLFALSSKPDQRNAYEQSYNCSEQQHIVAGIFRQHLSRNFPFSISHLKSKLIIGTTPGSTLGKPI